MPKTSSRSPSALVHEPEEWPRVFEKHLNSGELEGVVALYEPSATVDPSGNADEASHRAIEVLRRQPDGTWKLIVGDPNGRR